MNFIRNTLLLALLSSMSFLSVAQEKPYPNRPINWILPMSAGGTSDIFARTIQPFMTNYLGQTMVIENKPGANGVLGEDLGFNSKPDGYTLIFSSASVAANPFLRNTNYDPRKFVPVIHLGNVYLVMLLNKDVKATNMKEFLNIARNSPAGKLNYSSWGVGGMGHLAGELFNIEAKIKLTHIPYKGSPEAMAGAISGQTEATFLTTSIAFPQVKADKLRAIAIAAPNRLKDAPGIPTMAEVGLPGIKIDTWFGVFLPPETPKSIAYRLNAAFQAALNDPETKSNIEKRGIYVAGGSPDDFDTYFKSEMSKFDRLIKDAAIERTK
jgi:tripartite-type tricarboxylate transporter receptor subunit TctC